MNITARRLELVQLLTAACAPATVYDDATAVVTDDGAVVIRWDATRYDTAGRQWLHTFEVECIATLRDVAERLALRDQLVRAVLVQTNAAQGWLRPTATTTTVTIGGQDYERMGLVTITATDDPTTTTL